MKTDLQKLEKDYLGKLINRIVAIRKEKGLSQERLAIESEIARSLMRGYERKERNISFANLTRIVKWGLKMDFEEFFSEGFDKEIKREKKVQSNISIKAKKKM